MQKVTGELYEVDNTVLEVLDEFEQHPTVYTRTPMHCVMDEGHEDVVDCETYLVFNYREDLLKQPFLDCYDDSTPGYKPYVTRKDRSGGPSIVDQIKITARQ